MSKKEFSPPKNELSSDIKLLIQQSRQRVAVSVNSAITILYWQIGKRINEEVLLHGRADYGKQIVQTLSSQLVREYGKGWGEKHLRHCLRIAETIQDKEILYAVSRELSWTHLRSIIYIDEPLKRTFYIEMCKLERWSTRVLQERMNSMLYERTAISKKPELTIQNELDLLKGSQQISPDLVFRDPYFLDFLGLKDGYLEKDVESAIIKELELFILELGKGFAFVERQKRMIIDGEDFYLDLLFFHRKLKRLVAIELKLGKFKPAYKGQMELYLKWLDKYEKQENENSPIGLILCAGKSEEQVELLQMHKDNIMVADYWTELPPKKELEEKLHSLVKEARARIENRKLLED